jgi:hypothetical protein
MAIGLNAGQVLFVEMRNLPLSLPLAPDTSDAAYEALLRRGLDTSFCEKGPDHQDTIAHRTALAAHLESRSGSDEAHNQ